MSPTYIAAYLALFTLAGFAFLFVNLLIGKLLRPRAPTAEKLEVYECGEPTIGSSFVQFDLRFYVIALLFIIFDVEVAFFFPWAAVFGKATHLMDENLAEVEAVAVAGDPVATKLKLAPYLAIEQDLGVPRPTAPSPQLGREENIAQIQDTARLLAITSIADILVFFGVLLVGFAYVWRRGDLDWVRAVGRQPAARPPGPAPGRAVEQEPALAG